MNTTIRLTALALLAAANAGLAQTAARSDAGYPGRPVKVIVAYSPGGGVDVTSRAIAQRLTESFGQPVLVENRPGANGLVGAQALTKSAPDGYTLLVIDRAGLTINPSLYKALPYDPLADFAYTGIALEIRYVLAINAKLPITDFREFVQYAKSKPGVLNFASFGTGSIIHLNFEQMNAHLGIEMTHIPYKGATRAAAAAIAGEVGMMMSSYQGLASFVRDGRLRALAIARPSRLPMLPEVPTLAEVGGGEDTVVPGYFTFVAPNATPKPILERLNAEMRRVIATPEMMERFEKTGMEPHSATPEEFAASVKRDVERFSKLVRFLGIQAQ